MLLINKNLLTTITTICLLTCVFSNNQTRGFFDFLFSPCRCKCGVPNREARLLGGEFLKTYEFPWLALIQIKGISTIPATIINNKYVITGASRIFGLTPFDVKVTLGTYDRCIPDISSSNVSVDKIILHPEFAPGNKAHDLALIKLSSPITFENRISSICLSIPGRKYQGQVATVAGWLENESPETGIVQSCQPRKLGLPILGHIECVGSNIDLDAIEHDEGCVGIVGAPSVICKIDAGSPVMYRSHSGIYELVGVLNDKNECGKPIPGYFTNINKHIAWITSNTKDACYCFKT